MSAHVKEVSKMKSVMTLVGCNVVVAAQPFVEAR